MQGSVHDTAESSTPGSRVFDACPSAGFRVRGPISAVFLFFFLSGTIFVAASCSDSSRSNDRRITNDVAYGDLDGDGALDVVLARRRRVTLDEDDDPSDLSFVLRDPTRPFRWVRTQSPNTGRNPRQVEIVDYDGDGRLEVLAINRSPSDLSICFPDPSEPGRYFPPTRIAVGERPTAFVIVDLDGDGFLDLAFANTELTALSILFQDPMVPGSFFAEERFEIGERQAAIVSGDVDGDTRPDLVVATETRVFVVLQDAGGGGVFTAPVEVFGPARPSAVAIGDLNADGRLDLVIADREPDFGQVHVLLQDPAGSGAFATAQSLFTIDKPTDVAIGDVDRDDLVDFVVTSFRERQERSDEGWMSVFLQQPAIPGEFFESDAYSVSGETRSPRIVDLDADGFVDVLVASGAARVFDAIPDAPGRFERSRVIKR